MNLQVLLVVEPETAIEQEISKTLEEEVCSLTPRSFQKSSRAHGRSVFLIHEYTAMAAHIHFHDTLCGL